jgi:hypothetical protein
MDAISDVAGDGRFGIASVDDTFVSRDWDFYAVFVEAAPVFFDQFSEIFSNWRGNVATYFEVCVEIFLISGWFEFYFCEFWVAIEVG